MRNKPKRFSFNLDQWKCGVMVHAGTTYEAFIKDAKARGLIPKDEILEKPAFPVQAQCVRWPHTRCCGLYFMEAKPCGSVVAHEALHATWHILTSNGIDPSSATEEVYTYTMEHIIREVGKRLW